MVSIILDCAYGPVVEDKEAQDFSDVLGIEDLVMLGEERFIKSWVSSIPKISNSEYLLLGVERFFDVKGIFDSLDCFSEDDGIVDITVEEDLEAILEVSSVDVCEQDWVDPDDFHESSQNHLAHLVQVG